MYSVNSLCGIGVGINALLLILSVFLADRNAGLNVFVLEAQIVCGGLLARRSGFLVLCWRMNKQ